jgi:hypothetical protein
MLTITIHQALTGNIETREHCFYLYRDQEVIFYIGRSFFPLERLREHLGWGMFNGSRSPLGVFILEHLPQALSWTMELRTALDCDSLVRHYRPEYHDWYQQHLHKRLTHEIVEVAEEVLIEHYHPCLNITGNRQGAVLPERYQHKSGASQNLLLLQMILGEE